MTANTKQVIYKQNEQNVPFSPETDIESIVAQSSGADYVLVTNNENGITVSNKTASSFYVLPIGGIPSTDIAEGVIPDVSGFVPNTRTVNGKALSSNITLSASDVGASSVTIDRKVSTGTNIADITINGTKTELYAPAGGGTATDVQINSTSITNNNVANIVTEGNYSATTNKIATMSDLPSVPVIDVTVGGTSVVSSGTAVIPAIPAAQVNSDWNSSSGVSEILNKPKINNNSLDSNSTSDSLGLASKVHTHGNITDGGALQTSDITIDNGDKLVVTDSSDSNKVARASASFDGTTTTKALTPKGTFETFLKTHQDISGKQDKIDSNNMLSADLVDDANTTNKFVTASDKTNWDGKQNALAFEGTYDATNNKAATMSAVIPSSTEIKNIVYISESDYNNLGTKVATTLYVIPESNA